MKQTFTAVTWQEGSGYVAQCLDVDVASQGDTETEALANLQEALHLYFAPPYPGVLPEQEARARAAKLHRVEVEIAEVESSAA